MFWQTVISGGRGLKSVMLFRKIPQENSMSIKDPCMALQNQCMKPPPHLFLSNLLKPNTENVLVDPHLFR